LAQARRELGLDGREQGVHRLGELPDLGSRLGDRHSAVQAGAVRGELGSDLVRGAGYPPQPTKAEPHAGRRRCQRQKDRGRTDDQLQFQQPAHRAVDFIRREPHDEYDGHALKTRRASVDP